MAAEASAPPTVTVCLLPERLDTAAAPHLKNLLEKTTLDAAGMDVVLDATHVTYLGGLCLQIVLASRCKLSVISEELKVAYSLFGVTPDMVRSECYAGELN